MNRRSEMSQPIKRSTFLLTAATLGMDHDKMMQPQGGDNAKAEKHGQ